jgi:hypothetical protein
MNSGINASNTVTFGRIPSNLKNNSNADKKRGRDMSI